ncbi:MAG: site-2 protease family protein [Planctomycetota bacterium]
MNVTWPDIIVLAAVIYSIVLHELAHALVAFWCGDKTGRDLGRITLNPIPNISLIGSILVPIIVMLQAGLVFGWAKPVPVVPANYRRLVLGDILVSMAGIVMNLLIAFLMLVVAKILLRTEVATRGDAELDIVQKIAQWNVLLVLLNLIPIPPLDGHHVAKYLLPRRLRGPYQSLGFAGLVIVVILMIWQGHRLHLAIRTVLRWIADFVNLLFGGG